MRWFGIVLIVFNLLAAGGFLWLATQDWKGRQTITAAGIRHNLLLQGLPVEPSTGPDPDGFDPATDEKFETEVGTESIKIVSKKLLENYFATNTKTGAGELPAATGTEPPPPPVVPPGKVPLSVNSVVTNQLAEVKRVQTLIKAELAKTELTAADKLERLKGWVLYQAEDINTRVKYLDMIAKGDVAGLEAALDARFAAAMAKPQMTDSPSLAPPAEGEVAPTDKDKAAKADMDKLAKANEWRSGVPIDETQRRLNIAHLLIHLDSDANWQKRVMVVVGLRRYAKAVAVQVLRFGDMIRQIEGYIPDDQASFAKEENILREQATQHQERAKAVSEIKAALVEQKTAKEDAVNRQKTQLKELTDQLTKVKNEVDELLVKQTGIEKQLFEIQREVGLTLEEVYRLEALLSKVERERFGLTEEPKP